MTILDEHTCQPIAAMHAMILRTTSASVSPASYALDGRALFACPVCKQKWIVRATKPLGATAVAYGAWHDTDTWLRRLRLKLAGK